MTQPDPQFEQLLLYLKESRGFDFTGYKRSSLMRRVGRRMAQVSVPDYAEYLDYLEVHPEEFTALFNTILINVTSFFRDVEAWDHLRTEVIPALLAAKETGAPIRVWSAELRLGRGGVQPGDHVVGDPRCRRVPAPGQDLRHRRRRGGAHRGAARLVLRA
nr:hypothetical protein GCM10020092_037290 [Actinoplanes digitatis]